MTLALRRRAWLHLPNVDGILGNGAVAGELPRAGDIRDSLACVPIRVGLERQHALIRLENLRAVPASLVAYLFCREDEPEKAVLACFLCHLDVGAIARADRQRRVHHELYVACAANLMLLVPLTSKPAVKIWFETSLAGSSRSDSETESFPPTAHRQVAGDRAR